MNNVTVGIPYHNAANPEQLCKAIESIINQHEKPQTIHLIQDGPVSQDIKNVVNKFIDFDLIEHIVFNENQGLAKALNFSIKKTVTKYYARMDADDIAEPHRLKRQMEFLNKHPDVDVVGSWARDIDENASELSIRKVPSNHKDIVKYIWTCPIIHPTVIFKRDAIIAGGLYNESIKRRQDYELWFRCVKKGLIFANIPEPLLKYRFTEDWFKKNNAKVIWQQVKMGWKGCWLIGAPPQSYIGSTFPLVKILLPKWLGMKLTNTFKKIDPRDKTS